MIFAASSFFANMHINPRPTFCIMRFAVRGLALENDICCRGLAERTKRCAAVQYFKAPFSLQSVRES